MARPFGNIRQLGSGRYQARYTGPDGRQHAAPITFERKGDARFWLGGQEQVNRRGQWVDPQAGLISFEGYVSSWWETKSTLAPSTMELYTGFLARHILSTFGGRRLNEIAPVEVRRWHTELSSSSLSPNTVAKIYRLLKQIFGSALTEELIQRNPCMIPGAGTERVAERKSPSTEQVLAIIENTNPRFRALVLTAALTGLRFGELAGLQRRHINPLQKTLTVEQQLAQVGGRRQLRPPKTSAGHRILALPQAALEALNEHLADFCSPDRNAFVFTTSDGHTLERNNFRNRVWLPACRAADVQGLRFHDLRHHAATLAAASGVPLKALMQRLGHSTVHAAMIYQHAAIEDELRIAAHIDTQFGPRLVAPPVR